MTDCDGCGADISEGYMVQTGDVELDGRMTPLVKIYCYSCLWNSSVPTVLSCGFKKWITES